MRIYLRHRLVPLVVAFLAAVGMAAELDAGVWYSSFVGNERCVVEQDNHYYPYGMLMGESSNIIASARGYNGVSFNPYLFGSKEYLTTASANLLDFTARTYDPATLLFQTQDPKSTDYTPFNAYLYCGGDPVNKIDPTGENIAVVILDGVIGHMALLIQRPDESWAYYSVNGDKIYESTSGLSGGPKNDVGVGSWKSPEEFLNFMNDASTDNDKNATVEMTKYEYSEAYEISTTPDQDEKIANEFSKIAEEDYNFISNNCAHAVQRSLIEAGVLPSETTVQQSFSPGNFGYSIMVATKQKTHYAKPSAAFSIIKSNNPNGKSYTKSK